jgi:hypothetical protein
MAAVAPSRVKEVNYPVVTAMAFVLFGMGADLLTDL